MKYIDKLFFRKFLISLFVFTLSMNVYSQNLSDKLDPNKFVNPFIGTAEHGHTFPGAVVPFGMVQLSPDNGTSGWDWCSGYNYSDTVIIGFSHTHLSGTGIGDLCDILFMPAVMSIKTDADSSKLISLHSQISHKHETAKPGYYSVLLESFNIKAEITATKRAGFQKYTFPKSDDAVIVLNLGHSLNWDKTTATYIKVINDNTIVGYRISTGWAKDQRVYFATKFSKPFRSYFISLNNHLMVNKNEEKGKFLEGIFKFKTLKDEAILVKTGISSASINGAMENLNAEIPSWNFKRVEKSAANAWQKELGKIEIDTPDKSLKEIFYTALYHTMIEPSLFSDVNGDFKGADSLIHKAVGYNQYTVFSLWDTFRAEHPLFTIIEQNRVNDFIRSMLAHYEETGLLPVWELEGNEANTMIGYHAVPVIADAILKGFHGFNVKEAYKAMKKSAMQNHFGLKYYKDLGFIPADKENESVSKTLEYAYDDWCIAQVAEHLKKGDDYNLFMRRADNYRNLFDTSTNFFRGKESNGSWRTPFDPRFSNHRNDDYTEGDAWQWNWFVPQDVAGLIQLMGGVKHFTGKLDSLFDQSPVIEGKNASPDISGMVGQYAQGNEPSHHIAYLYNYAGEPWKTQKIVRKIMETLYTDSTNGLCGNDDCGQMSAWYVFSSMGFYPVNPSDGIYIIGSPMFNKVSIQVGKGKYFIVIARNVSSKNKFIQSAELNGRQLYRSYIYHKEILDGGTLILEMGNKPNKSWGSEKKDFPPSMSSRN
ncbi:MAG: GH92 family glycosyl hydrolase [Ignavibacteriaceae bacterium]